MASVLTKVSSKGWVVIPQELRKRYGLRRGALVRFVDYGGVLAIFPVPDDPVRAGFGMFKGRRFTDTLLDERRSEREKEDR